MTTQHMMNMETSVVHHTQQSAPYTLNLNHPRRHCTRLFLCRVMHKILPSMSPSPHSLIPLMLPQRRSCSLPLQDDRHRAPPPPRGNRGTAVGSRRCFTDQQGTVVGIRWVVRGWCGKDGGSASMVRFGVEVVAVVDGARQLRWWSPAGWFMIEDEDGVAGDGGEVLDGNITDSEVKVVATKGWGREKRMKKFIVY